MALVVGTNCGFCAVAPTTDPAGASTTGTDAQACVFLGTSPPTAGRIVEIGWYASAATEAADFDVGVYAADGVVVPGEAGTLLHSAVNNAKGTTEGWKVVTGLDWAINGSTNYWLAVQCNDTATTTGIDSTTTGGPGFDRTFAATALPNPYNGGALLDTDGLIAIYVVWEADEVAVLTSFVVLAEGGGSITNKTTNVAFNIRIEARDQFDEVFTDFEDTVDVSSDGSLSAGSGTTASFTAGVLTHSVTFDTPDTAITISVEDTGTGLILGESNAFDVEDPPTGVVLLAKDKKDRQRMHALNWLPDLFSIQPFKGAASILAESVDPPAPPGGGEGDGVSRRRRFF